MVEVNIKGKSRRKKKIGILISLFLLILLGAVSFGGYTLYKTYLFTNKVFKSEGINKSISSFLPNNNKVTYTSDVDKALKTNQNVNILLLGYGGAGHDGGYLTDSIMVASINPIVKNISLISIPRDMWVQIPSNANYSSYGKINSAFSIGMDKYNYQGRSDKYKGDYGAGNMSKDVVSGIVGLPINYYVSVNFLAFKQIVDDIGGVDVTVDNTFDDYAYPSGDTTTDGPICYAPMNTKTTCRYWHLHFDKGLQHMDGPTALEYARSRHAYGVEGSDFARAQRQQKIMVAIKQKALQVGSVTQAFNIMTSLQDNIQTDMSISDAKDLMLTLKDWNLDYIDHEALTNENYLASSVSSDGQSILIPRLGIGKYSDIQKSMGSIWSDVEEKNLKIELVNGGLNDKSFSTLVEEFKAKGADVTLSTTEVKTSDTSSIYDFTKGKYTDLLNSLKDKFTTDITSQTLPANPNKAAIIIVVGKNYLSTTK